MKKQNLLIESEFCTLEMTFITLGNDLIIIEYSFEEEESNTETMDSLIQKRYGEDIKIHI